LVLVSPDVPMGEGAKGAFALANFVKTLTTFVQLKIGEREKWPLSLGLTGMAWALLYFVFKGVLHLPFPKGQLFRWLGLPSIF
jgi:succinate dehydrogenase/fumarate reductase cytochrome b subunit